MQLHFNARPYSWMHDSSKQLVFLQLAVLLATCIWISINLHACNIAAVAMIATVNTTAMTITLAIADSCSYILIHAGWLTIAYMYIYACIICMHGWIHVFLDLNIWFRIWSVASQLAMCRSYCQITDFCIRQLVTYIQLTT